MLHKETIRQGNKMFDGAQPDAREKQLIHQAQQGDTQALGQLWLRHEKKLFRTISAQVHNDVLAEDIVQEVFIKVMQRINDFRNESNFFTWAYRIALNSMIDHVRSKKRERTSSIEELNAVREEHGEAHYEPVASTEDGLGKNREIDMLQGESEQQMRAAVTHLDRHYKDVVQLFYFDHQPYKTIAHLLNIPIGTVMSRLDMARKKLRELLKQHDYEQFSQRIVRQDTHRERTIQQIPDTRKRITLWLSEVHGLPQVEIIQRTGYPKGTIQYWVQHWRTYYNTLDTNRSVEEQEAEKRENTRKQIEKINHPRTRQVTALSIVEGKTQKEIAAQIHMSEAMVNHYAQLGRLELAAMDMIELEKQKQQEAKKTLQADIATIANEELRTILILKLIEGKTNREMAEHLGVSTGTIHNRLKEGHALLATIVPAEILAQATETSMQNNAQLAECIHLVPDERSRRLLTLYLLEQQNSVAIGALLHTSPQTVRRQLQIAQAELRVVQTQQALSLGQKQFAA